MRYRNLFLAVLLILASSVFAQTSSEKIVLTVDDAVKYASDNNIDIKQQKIALDKAEETRKKAWGIVIPSARLGGNFQMPYMNENQDFSLSFTANLSLTLTPSIYAGIKAAILQHEMGELTYDQVIRSIELGVRRAFYALLYSQENIASLRRTVDSTKRQYDQTLAQYKVGQKSELDMIQSRVNYENYLPTLESTITSYKNDMSTFKQLLNIPMNKEVELSGSLSEESNKLLKEITVEYDVDEMPTVKIAGKRIDMMKNNLLLQRFTAWGPSITFGVTYGQARAWYPDTPAIRMQKLMNPDLEKWSDTNLASFSVGVSIPLDGYLPWSTGGKNISQAKKDIADAELAMEKEKTSVQVEIDKNLSQIKVAQAQIDSIKGTVDFAEKSYEMTRTAYNQGMRDLLTLRNAADQVLQANFNLAGSQFQLISAVLGLESTLGVPFGTIGK